ncbi:MAG TPA: F-box protein [Rhabdochlamydiaceae bacterium]|nr:F-box protein [Rhabdochlamydiaceae bacterium]
MSTISNNCEFFASPVARLCNDAFSNVLSFFGPKELALLEKVCTSWKTFIGATDQWKKHCQHRLNIPAHLDPKSFLREGWNYKKGALFASPKVFDGRMYEYFLEADIGPVPPIPEEISLERRDEPDPCDPTETIGRNYTWIYCPEGFTFEDPPFDLDKADDPIDEEAPGLIPKEVGKSEEKRVLTVPNTINNIGEIFKHPTNGNPSAYDHIWVGIAEQHGNKRIRSGWICMREDTIGENRSFNNQQKIAKKAGVIISPLLHRVIFNFLIQTSSRMANTWPDGKSTYTRTSYLYRDLYGILWLSGCGDGGPSGLRVGSGFFFSGTGPNVGAAVVLPVKTQTIDP